MKYPLDLKTVSEMGPDPCYSQIITYIQFDGSIASPRFGYFRLYRYKVLCISRQIFCNNYPVEIWIRAKRNSFCELLVFSEISVNFAHAHQATGGFGLKGWSTLKEISGFTCLWHRFYISAMASQTVNSLFRQTHAWWRHQMETFSA